MELVPTSFMPCDDIKPYQYFCHDDLDESVANKQCNLLLKDIIVTGTWPQFFIIL